MLEPITSPPAGASSGFEPQDILRHAYVFTDFLLKRLSGMETFMNTYEFFFPDEDCPARNQKLADKEPKIREWISYWQKCKIKDTFSLFDRFFEEVTETTGSSPLSVETLLLSLRKKESSSYEKIFCLFQQIPPLNLHLDPSFISLDSQEKERGDAFIKKVFSLFTSDRIHFECGEKLAYELFRVMFAETKEQHTYDKEIRQRQSKINHFIRVMNVLYFSRRFIQEICIKNNLPSDRCGYFLSKIPAFSSLPDSSFLDKDCQPPILCPS